MKIAVAFECHRNLYIKAAYPDRFTEVIIDGM